MANGQPQQSTVDQQMSPVLDQLVDAGIKKMKKIQDDQIDEAVQSGVPLEHIVDTLQKKANQTETIKSSETQALTANQPEQILNQIINETMAQRGAPQQQAQTPQILPPEGLFSGGGVTPGGDIQRPGFIGGFFGPTTSQMIGQQKTLAETAKLRAEAAGKGGLTTPQLVNALEEKRRIGAEVRRTDQLEIMNIKETGITLDEGELQAESERLNRDFNAQIEAFGIPATIDKDGNRSYNIPPQKELERRIATRSFAPAEVEHLNDIDIVGNDMAKLVGDLRAMGMTPQDGASLFSDLGKLSLPARSDILGQYMKGPEFTDAKRRLERVFQRYRKIITGAQASDKELKTIRPLITAFTDQPEVFFATAESLVSEARRAFNTRLDLYQAAGRDVTKMRGLLEKRAAQDKQRTGAESFRSERAPIVTQEIEAIDAELQSINAELGGL